MLGHASVLALVLVTCNLSIYSIAIAPAVVPTGSVVFGSPASQASVVDRVLFKLFAV